MTFNMSVLYKYNVAILKKIAQFSNKCYRY